MELLKSNLINPFIIKRFTIKVKFNVVDPWAMVVV